MASLKVAYITVGEQITGEQLIEKRIVMMISKAMVMNIGITSVLSRPNSPHRPLSNMHLDY